MVSHEERNELYSESVRTHRLNEEKYLSFVSSLLEAPSLKRANALYDQSFAEVLAFKNLEPDATTLRRFVDEF